MRSPRGDYLINRDPRRNALAAKLAKMSRRQQVEWADRELRGASATRLVRLAASSLNPGGRRKDGD
jgi:hypothetical protein